MTADNRSTGDPTDRDEDATKSEQDVPPANPAYATPPPEGLPDADRD